MDSEYQIRFIHISILSQSKNRKYYTIKLILERLQIGKNHESWIWYKEMLLLAKNTFNHRDPVSLTTVEAGFCPILCIH